MGALSAQSSLNRVLEAHGEELQQEYLAVVPEAIQPHLHGVDLYNNTYSLDVLWVFKDGAVLDGPSISIDDLADRFPDCEVGY